MMASSATGSDRMGLFERKIVDKFAIEAFRSESISSVTDTDQKRFRTQVRLIKSGFERKISDKLAITNVGVISRQYEKPTYCFLWMFVMGVLPCSAQPGWRRHKVQKILAFD